MNNIIITESCSTLRALGREALRGKWMLAVAGTLLFTVCVQVPSIALMAYFGSGISWLFDMLITGPFTLGFVIFMLSIFRNQQPGVGQVFYGFERFGKSLALHCITWLFITLWTMLLIIPGVIAQYRYSQAFYILSDNPELGFMECIERSKQMMYGNKMKLFLVQLSFIGWYILASLPVGAASTFFSYEIVNKIDMSSFTDVSAYYAYLMEQLLSSPMTICMFFIASIGTLWVTAYVGTTQAGFYEILSGNLRPGTIKSTAEIVEPQS